MYDNNNDKDRQTNKEMTSSMIIYDVCCCVPDKILPSCHGRQQLKKEN